MTSWGPVLLSTDQTATACARHQPPSDSVSVRWNWSGGMSGRVPAKQGPQIGLSGTGRRGGDSFRYTLCHSFHHGHGMSGERGEFVERKVGEKPLNRLRFPNYPCLASDTSSSSSSNRNRHEPGSVPCMPASMAILSVGTLALIPLHPTADKSIRGALHAGHSVPVSGTAENRSNRDSETQEPAGGGVPHRNVRGRSRLLNRSARRRLRIQPFDTNRSGQPCNHVVQSPPFSRSSQPA